MTDKPRLVLFAAGDVGFNLYWQSATYYLLFYYTEVLGLPIRTAAAIFLAASVWDGIASCAIGLVIDARGAGRAQRALVVGAAPLGVGFCLAYAAPNGGAAAALAGQLLFRTAYAAVNVPYLALSSRISADSDERSFVAGCRMLAGTAAAVCVAAGTVPLARALGGSADALLAPAILFAAVATVVIALVGWTFRDALPHVPAARLPVARALADLARNRAFTTLAAAMMAMIVATTVLGKSVLYYFKYVLHDQASGQLALASMLAVGGAAVPVWMLVARRIGARRQWLWAAALCCVGLAFFALVDVRRIGATELLLVALQAATAGLHLAFWSMLPDTVEWGQRLTGRRVEATAFGLATLLQRVAIGGATLILGLAFDGAGFRANTAQSAATLAQMRLAVAAVPLAFFGLSILFIAANPLRRGVHAAVVRELERGSGSI